MVHVSLLLGATALTAVINGQVFPNLPIWPEATYPDAVNAIAAKGAKFGQLSDPFYPSPWMNGKGDWAGAYQRAQAFVKQLTLLEKVNLTTGTSWQGDSCVGNAGNIPRLNFKGFCLEDSPVGVRNTDFNSVFPSGQTTAATFSRDLFFDRGNAMGKEHRGKGVTIQLGPVAGPLGRAPEGGRGWEGFSPDPVLTGIAMAQTIKGIQQNKVIACAKHFIGNEQEHFRQAPEAAGYGFKIDESVSTNMDDVTLHELYLWPFADAVRAGVGSVMCSYNQMNNSYACQNSKLLNNVLKDELGFQGFVMSDWMAHHSGVSGSLAGLDMSMPGDTLFDTGVSFWGGNLTLAVANGTIPEWRIDDMATRIMAAYFKVGLTLTEPAPNFNAWTLDTVGPVHPRDPTSENGTINKHVDVQENGAHASLIRTIAAKGTVLLKNLNHQLPLSKPKSLAVIGADAGGNPNGPNACPDRSCDIGTLAMGWGSGTANYLYLVTPDAALSKKAKDDGSKYTAILDNYATSKIISAVSQPDVTAIVFVNADSGEGYINIDDNQGDRKNLTLWYNGDDLIKAVASHCKNTIVVMHTVGPVLITEWYQSPNITAILWAGLPGQESGNSITDVLYGRENPAGRLPFTWGATRESFGTDLLYRPNNGEAAPQMQFTEGVFIDYRSFDARNIKPIYEFGFGLSYTTFEYSNIRINKINTGPYTPNTGKTAAAPILGNFSTNLADYLFPKGWRHYIEYIYPWITSTDGKVASGDANYGLPADSYLPPHATDGSPQPVHPAGGAPGGNPGLYTVVAQVNVDVKNIGNLPGEEVPQLYVNLGGPNDPKVVLRAFQRLQLGSQSSTTWTADITRRDISNWDPVTQNWVVTKFPKTFYVGPSSRQLLLKAVL